MWEKHFLSPTCLHQSSQEDSGGLWKGVDLGAKKIKPTTKKLTPPPSSALLLWAVFSISNKGCTLDEDTEGIAKHKTH